jgi:hypothetical protein
MRVLNTMRVFSLVLLTICSSSLAISQDRSQPPVKTATVAVVAVDNFGDPSPNATVESFNDQEGHDLIALFRSGTIAKGVPFGKYLISVRAGDGYYKSTFEVEISTPEVLITADVEQIGLVENIRVTLPFNGRLVGYPAKLRNWWCKASGLYTRMQYESAAKMPDLTFDFGAVPNGPYVVACVANREFVVLRIASPDGNGKPCTINYRPDEDVDAITRLRLGKASVLPDR